MKSTVVLISIILLELVSTSMTAQDKNLKTGDIITPFSALADDGSTWHSDKYIGNKYLVVYFYPAAMTGGCTKQACAYRDDEQQLKNLNAVVVGVSADRVENLSLFKKAHNLNFSLLSDADGQLAHLFGVPVNQGEKSIEREVEGKMYTLTRDMTTSRWTFILDKTGKIIYKSTEVNAAEDSKAVLEVLKSL